MMERAVLLALLYMVIALATLHIGTIDRIASPEVEWCLSKVNRFGLREVQLEPE